MRAVVGLFVLCMANAVAFGQSVERPSSPTKNSPEQVKEIEKRVADWRTTCLQDWDAATHMTRAEWRTTCERVASERRTFLLNNGNAVPMDSKTRRR
jgi:hypothetical protein